MEFEKRLSQILLMSRIISGAILATLGIYLALAELQLKYSFHEPLTPLYRELRTEHIVQCAIYEGIGTVGLILFIVGGGNAYDLYAFLAVAALLILAHFPQANAWREKVEQLSKDSKLA